jgi:hypothetical protein
MADDASPRSGARVGYRLADRVSTDRLAQWLRDALTGAEHAGAPAVIWEDRGAQVLLHVGKLQVHTRGTALIVAVDTETEEFGRAPLIVRFVLGSARDAASLVASSDEVVHGDPRVAARWGPQFRSVVWAAIVRMAEAHAGERGLQARAMSILGDHLRLTAEPAPALSLRSRAIAHRKGAAQ